MSPSSIYWYVDSCLLRKPTDVRLLGSALCRFERSFLPQHSGNRTVVLRVMKITEPLNCIFPNYDGRISEPTEGSLLSRGFPPQPWSCNVDDPNVPDTEKGLSVLFN
jgi:hypothetical protein